MKEKLANFMRGRYGFDALYRFLIFSGLLCLVLSSLFRHVPFFYALFYYGSLALLIWALYRALSRNTEKRYLENLHYMELQGQAIRHIRIKKEEFHQRKDYKFFVCPNCKTHLRVPRGIGKVNITCSKCGTRFQRKT